MKKIILLSMLFSFLLACTEVQNSSSKVLDNAGEVVESGSKKLWIDPDQKDSDNDKNK